MSGVQQSLGAFTTHGWELVGEHPDNPSGYGVDCPDCAQSMDVGLWPVGCPEIGGVHGFGCERCRTVVPIPASEHSRTFGAGDGYYVDEVSLRDGSTRISRCVDTATDREDSQ